MITRKIPTETPKRKETEAARRSDDARQNPKPSEALDEKSLDEVMHDCPL